MKKVFALLLVIAMMCGLCACASAPEVPEDATKIGYVIIPHADGDEYADIYKWNTNSPIIYAYCMDGRLIASPHLTLVLEP